jgi:hypothetical protein
VDTGVGIIEVIAKKFRERADEDNAVDRLMKTIAVDKCDHVHSLSQEQEVPNRKLYYYVSTRRVLLLMFFC